MKKVNIHEAKTHLSRYAKEIKAGETVILCERNVPFAEIRSIPGATGRRKRRFGLYKGKIRVTKHFDAADPELEQAFEESRLFPKP